MPAPASTGQVVSVPAAVASLGSRFHLLSDWSHRPQKRGHEAKSDLSSVVGAYTSMAVVLNVPGVVASSPSGTPCTDTVTAPEIMNWSAAVAVSRGKGLTGAKSTCRSTKVARSVRPVVFSSVRLIMTWLMRAESELLEMVALALVSASRRWAV